jgi:KEOPS complex subunit Pcc1
MTSYVHEATYAFDFDSAEAATVVERSVQRELGEIDGDRSTADVAREGPRLEVRLEAADLVALRAATNTWLSLVGVAERTAETGRSRAAGG